MDLNDKALLRELTYFAKDGSPRAWAYEDFTLEIMDGPDSATMRTYLASHPEAAIELIAAKERLDLPTDQTVEGRALDACRTFLANRKQAMIKVLHSFGPGGVDLSPSLAMARSDTSTVPNRLSELKEKLEEIEDKFRKHWSADHQDLKAEDLIDDAREAAKWLRTAIDELEKASAREVMYKEKLVTWIEEDTKVFAELLRPLTGGKGDGI